MVAWGNPCLHEERITATHSNGYTPSSHYLTRLQISLCSRCGHTTRKLPCWHKCWTVTTTILLAYFLQLWKNLPLHNSDHLCSWQQESWAAEIDQQANHTQLLDSSTTKEPHFQDGHNYNYNCLVHTQQLIYNYPQAGNFLQQSPTPDC